MAAAKTTTTTETTTDTDTKSDEKVGQEFPYYCPGCGRRWNYQTECVGTPTAPHAPIEVISTDELDGDPEKHTAAPDTT